MREEGRARIRTSRGHAIVDLEKGESELRKHGGVVVRSRELVHTVPSKNQCINYKPVKPHLLTL